MVLGLGFRVWGFEFRVLPTFEVQVISTVMILMILVLSPRAPSYLNTGFWVQNIS